MLYTELIDNPRYKLLDELSHDEMKSFILAEMVRKPLYARIISWYQVVGVLTFLAGTFLAFLPVFTKRESVYLWWLLAGIVFSFTVFVLLHELIHAAAYRYVGAKNISFGMYLRKFMFYVQADRQVLNYKQFRIVALAPAVVISWLQLLEWQFLACSRHFISLFRYLVYTVFFVVAILGCCVIFRTEMIKIF